MSTFMANASNIERKWYIIDAADKSMGRIATVAASLLRGKHKVTFTPHADCGDHVIILNADKVVLTGNKLETKYWRRHSGYVGGLKEIQYKTLMATRADKAIELAVWGMLPKNSIGRACMPRLKVYKGAEHINEAQKPVVWEGDVAK